ncbi:MAG: hypothetical protein J1G38_06520 [Clostridiales bacterium]|nr:hypothetical protein [Clostridiales bacterium]
MKKRAENSTVISKSKRLLILIVSGIIAIALGLTCGLCFGTSSTTGTTSGVEGGDVSRSATKTLTSAGTYTYTASGAIINNDVINMQYCGGLYTIKLPKGTYKFEVWGAQGGNAANNAYKGGWGGKGGYAVGAYTITADSATVYVIVGQQGYSYGSTVKHGAAGGFGAGGGGAHPWGSGNSSGGAGGGGLSGFFKSTTYLNNEILIAGAGGGGGGSAYSSGSQHNAGTDGGWGGGTTGGASQYNLSQGASVSHKSSGNAAGGATQSAAGAAKGSGKAGGRLYGGAGYGTVVGNNGNPTTLAGGAALTTTPSGSSAGGGGGGGSGYWGGSGSGPYGMGGSGGSGWNGGVITTTVNGITVTKNLIAGNASMPAPSSGNETGHSGNGYAKITAIQVNQPPTAKAGVSFSLGARGTTGKSVPIAASAIAQDTDYANYSGGKITNVYFTNGTTSNLDTVSKSTTNLRLENGASASTYLDWNIDQNTITITGVKKYPRKGVDGSTQADGTLKLTTKVRDAFGTNTTRGYGDVTFLVTVTDNGIGMRAASNPNTGGKTVTDKGSYIEYSYSGTGGAYNYRVGNSDKSAAGDDALDYIGGGHIYNKLGSNKPTVFIPQPLTPNRVANAASPVAAKDGFTIKATDVYFDNDTVANMNDIVGIRSVAAGAATETPYYSILYNANSTLYGSTGLYESITIVPTALRPSKSIYVALTITAASCEQNGKLAFANNTAVTLVFKIANTRPLYASATSNNQGQTEPLITLKAGGDSVDLDLTKFVYDPDGTIPTFDTKAGSLKVPTNEYVSVTRENTLIDLKAGTNYNRGGSAATTYSTGEGATRAWRADLYTTPTSYASNDQFERIHRVIAQTGSADAGKAWLTYSYVGTSTIRFTPRAASQYMYADAGRSGDFYVLVRVLDPGDTSDDGIWFPIAIQVTSSAPREPSVTSSFTLGFDDVTTGTEDVDGKPGTAQSVILTPLSYTDTSGNMHGIGVSDIRTITSADAEQALPFVTDNDIFSIGSTASRTSEFNEIVLLAGDSIESIVNLCGAGEFFSVSLVRLFAHASVFSNVDPNKHASFGITPITDEEAGQATGIARENIRGFWGLRITANASTNNEYYEFDVKVKDSHGTVPEKIDGIDGTGYVRIYVKVNNRAPAVRREAEMQLEGQARTSYPFNTTKYGTYVPRAGARVASINYKLIAKQELIITPYDLAYDFDSVSGLNQKQSNGNYIYNTNPLDEGFADVARNKILPKYDVKSTATPSVAAKPAKVSRGALSFTNKDRFELAASDYSTYVTATVEDGFYVGDDHYAISCIKLHGETRTTANNPLLTVWITDGISTIEFAISVTVENAAPILRNPDTRVSLTAGKVAGGINSVQFTAWSTSEGSADGLAYDIDDDSVFFNGDLVRVVAMDSNGNYFDTLRLNGDGTYTPVANGSIHLSDYVGASITSGTGNYIGQQVLLVQAKSSTQLFNIPIYVEFSVVDGWRAQPGYATLRIGVEVINSNPTFEKGSLTEVDNGNKYTWYMQYDTISQKAADRYIINSKALYDSTVIQASAANKMLLFADADSEQTALLDTGEDKNVNDPGKLVMKSNNMITKDAFGTGTAIMYTQTYADSTGISEKFLDVEVLFFDRSGSVETGYTFTQIKDPSQLTNLDQLKYWAIKIKDKAATTTGALDTQIAIRYKDDHLNKDVYGYDRDTKEWTSSKNTVSGDTVVNFYYQYLSPGITAMHEYYRTDGQTESTIWADSATQSGDRKIQLEYLDADMFTTNELPSSQEALRTSSFTSRFRYRYFVNITGGDNEESKEVGKRYQDTAASAFYYEPVELTAEAAAIIPMSYIAMPKTFDITKGTASENETHVLFANVGTAGLSGYTDASFTANAGTPPYVSWATGNTANDVAIRAAILQNVTLTDDDGHVWRGSDGTLNNNDYITIEYTAHQSKLNSRYINYQRGVLTSSGDGTYSKNFSTHSGFNSSTAVSPYLEDRYGFRVTRKGNSPRYTGSLRLTVEVKTSGDGAKVETAFVDIQLQNSTPQNFNYNSDNYIDVDTGPGAGGDRGLTMANAEGSAPGAYIGFARSGNATFPVGAAYKYSLQFSDADATDEMMFYMPTATSGKLSGDGGLTAQERTYLLDNSVSTGSLTAYFGKNESSDITPEFMAEYEPNPGYETFFSVATIKGSTRTLQIIPNAKTALNIPSGQSEEEYLKANHLMKDTHGIYYPFRVLAYDSCNGSGFTEGKWVLVVVKVHISNSEILAKPVNETKLTKGVPSTLDVSTLISDNDIVMIDGRYVTEIPDTLPHDSNSKKASENSALIRDVLVMPVTGGNVVFTATDIENNAVNKTDLPITVEVDAESKTTLVFTATSAFKTKYKITLTFKDSALPTPTQDSVTITFAYSNEAPTENDDTYKGASLNITMRTGDSFTINSADVTNFDADVKGKFTSPSHFNGIRDYYPQKSAAELRKEFEPFIGGYDEDVAKERNHELGALIIAGDDAPSTLRILDSGTKMADENLRSLINLSFSNKIQNEGLGSNPVTVTVTARGVVTNAELIIAIVDSEGTDHLTYLKVYITVESSAPYVKDKLPANMTKKEVQVGGDTKTIYEVNLKYGGAPFEYEFEQFMDDDDNGDKDGFIAPAIYDGLTYRVTNSTGLQDLTISPLNVTTTSGLDRGNKIRIEAADYIPVKGEYTEVVFKVADAHGVQSEEITLRVYIAPSEMEVISSISKPAAITVQSYLKYSQTPTKQVIELVSANKNATHIYDQDASAPSARYYVTVYAMIMKNENGVMEPVRFTQFEGENSDAVKEATKLITVTEDGPSDNLNGEVYNYVRNFFELTVSDDGKTLTFVPNAANINPNGTLSSISLYIEVGKRFKDGNANVMPTKGIVQTNVTVENSAPEAIKSDGLNFGYPLKNGEELRSENFLEFSGYAGDSLTWMLCNPKDETLGLFRDYDLQKNRTGNEKLVFVAAKLGSGASGIPNTENILEDNTKPNDPVLTVSSNVEQGTLTIRINRKVKDGSIARMVIPVDIYVADMYTKKLYDDKAVTLNDCSKTTIMVTVLNSNPKFKEVDDIVTNRFTLSYDAQYGYEMYLSLAKGDALTVGLGTIVADADFDFDKYKLVSTDAPYLTDRPSDEPGKLYAADNRTELFEYYATNGNNDYNFPTLKSITFRCTSVARGEIAVCHMMLEDTSEARTSMLTIYLTVGNLAPKQKSADVRTITVMGLPLDSESTTAFVPPEKSNIVYYVTDENPNDAIDVATDYDPTALIKKSVTYVYIDSFDVLDVDAANPADRPILYGPGVTKTIVDSGTGETYIEEATAVCSITWADEFTHQTFAITVLPGVYGTQRINLVCRDGGFIDGSTARISDDQRVIVELIVTVACPVEDKDLTEPIKIAEGVSRKISPEMLLDTEEELRSAGYKIVSVESAGNLEVIAPTAVARASSTNAVALSDDEMWRVKALRRGGISDKITVTFDVGGITRVNNFNILVTENHKPELIKKSFEFTKNMLGEGNLISIKPETWFIDIDEDDVMRFVSPVKVASSQYAEVFLKEGDNQIDLKFKYRGETQVTITLSDASNRLYTYELTVSCTDMPEPSWFTSFLGNIESNPLMWGLIFGGILLFIIFLIVLLVILHKRRKMRREIEMLLNSEAELNEEMMQLSAGAGAGMFNSFGYLPPTNPTFNDPGLMLGSGAAAPAPNTLQLGAGTGESAGIEQPAAAPTMQTPPPVAQPTPPPPVQPASPPPPVQPTNPYAGNMPPQQGMPQQNPAYRPGVPPQQGVPPQNPYQQAPNPYQQAPQNPYQQQAPNPYQQAPQNPYQQQGQNPYQQQGQQNPYQQGMPPRNDGFDPNNF